MGLRRRTSVPAESSDDEDGVSQNYVILRESSTRSAAGVDGGRERNEVAVAESRVRKIALRTSVGAVMVTGFVGIVWAGHLYISALVVLIQVCMFCCCSCWVRKGIIVPAFVLLAADSSLL